MLDDDRNSAFTLSIGQAGSETAVLGTFGFEFGGPRREPLPPPPAAAPRPIVVSPTVNAVADERLAEANARYAEAVALVHATEYLASEAGQLKINAMIDERLASQDIATDSKIVEMDSNIASNTAGVEDNRDDIEFARQQLMDLGRILMQPPDTE